MSERGKVVELHQGRRPPAPRAKTFPRFERAGWCRGDGRVEAWLYLSAKDAVASVITCRQCHGRGCALHGR